MTQTPRHFRTFMLLLGTAIVASACGGGSSTTTTTTGSTTPSSTSTTPSSTDTTTPSSTGGGSSDVACAIDQSGTQSLVYNNADPVSNTSTAVSESLPYSYKWSCSTTTRTLTGNGVPNHAVTGGNFASKISAQTISQTFTLSPTLKTTSTSVKEPGYAINSVKFDPGTAGTCPNSATTDTNCNYAMGSDTWKMEALPGSVNPWKFNFGTDTSNAHVQPGGIYHYHGMPTELITKLNSASTTSMTLVGFAKDGFPIYANYGYTTATDATSALKKMTTSYKVKSTPDANRPSTSNFPLGHFTQDWEYVASLGDLDECNGRTGVTPEFPNGTYHYYITEGYPYIQRCVKGA